MGLQRSFTTSASQFISLNTAHGLFIDPEYGDVGDQMIDQLDVMGCIAALLPQAKSNGGSQQQQNQAVTDVADSKTVAGFLPFTFTNLAPEHRTPGTQLYSWENEVQFDPRRPELEKIISLGHEGTHALSWNRAAILHASPNNGYDPDKPDIVLCPTDAIRLIFLTEQIGYGAQAWLTSLAARLRPEFHQAAAKDPIKPEAFEALRANAPDLRGAIVQAANQAMRNAQTTTSEGALVKTFGQHYIDVALRSYENSLRLKKFPQGIIFVRMEYEDALPAGDTIGPNILTDQNLLGLGDLEEFFTPELKERLGALNARLGLVDANLPTFTQALAAQGHTPESYLTLSKMRPEITHQPLSSAVIQNVCELGMAA